VDERERERGSLEKVKGKRDSSNKPASTVWTHLVLWRRPMGGDQLLFPKILSRVVTKTIVMWWSLKQSAVASLKSQT
jgi:hypothetical protein